MYKKKSTGWLRHWDFEVLDILMLEISFLVSYLYRHHNGDFSTKDVYLKIGLLLAIIDFAIVFLGQNYQGIIQRRWQNELASVFMQVSCIYISLLVYQYIVRETEEMSRTVFLLGWGLSIISCFATRIIWKRVVRLWIQEEKHQSVIMVITNNENEKRIIDRILKKDYREYNIGAVGIWDGQKKNYSKESSLTHIIGEEEIFEYVRLEVVDEIYIDSIIAPNQIEKLINIFLGMGVTVHVGMEFLPSDLPNMSTGKIGDASVVTTSIKTIYGWEVAVKRFIDIIGALVGLVIMSIAYVFVAPQIKRQSPGPVFFKQQRVGKNGRIFYIYKFRSMYMDAEERKAELMDKNEMSGLMFKMENDPRIIGAEKGKGKGIGNFIRRTSIDELPQFWNVLKGDMSLVGTRPPTREEFRQYDIKHKIRLSMKPGITGMWQTSGRSDVTDFEEVVKLDTFYVENWSMFLDVKLLFKTVKVVLTGKGSK